VAPLAEAYVRVRADTSGVRREVRDEFGRAGGDAGQEFGRRFTRDANGRLRDERGKFVAEGTQLGAATGRGFDRGFFDQLRGLAPRLSGIFPDLSRVGSGLFDGLTVGMDRGLSGLRVAGTATASLTSQVGQLSAALGKVGVGAAAFSTLAAGAAAASASVIGLAAAAAPAVGALAALPGAMALSQAASATLQLALMGVGDAFKTALTGDLDQLLAATANLSISAEQVALEVHNISGLFTGLKFAAQEGFFRPLIGEVTELRGVLFTLQDGIRGVAGEFGLGARQLSDFVQSAASLAAITAIFGSLRDLIAALRPALEPLLAGLRDISVVGAAFVAGMGPGVADLARRFGEFLSQAAASGRALDWMQGALEVFRAFGAIAKDVGGILSGVFGAARSAGTGALGVIGQLLDKLNAFVLSAAGQVQLVAIFQALQRVGEALGPVIGAVASALAQVAPRVADIAVAFGPVLVSAIKAIGPAFAALTPGILAFIGDLGTAVKGLGPLLVPIGLAIGQALQAVGPIVIALAGAFAQLAPRIAEVVVAFAPVISTLITALAPALAALTPGIVAIGNALAAAFGNPAFAAALLSLATGFSNLLVAVSPLIPPLIELASIFVERFGAGLTMLATFLTPVISVLADLLAPLLPQISALLRDVSEALLPVAEQFGTLLADALRQLEPYMQPIMDALREVGGEILVALREVLPQITPHLGTLANAFGQLFVEVAKILPDLIKLGGEIIVELIRMLPILVPMVAELALAMLAVFREVAPLVPVLLRLFVEFIKPILPELPKLIGMLTELVLVFAELLRLVVPFLVKLLSSPEALAAFKIAGQGVVLMLQTLSGLFNILLGTIQIFLGVFFGMDGQVSAGLTRIGGAIKTWINDVIGWFESVLNTLVGLVPGLGGARITLQRLADGMIVRHRMIAEIGEAGPEVVIPLTRPQRAQQLAEQSGLLDMLARFGGSGRSQMPRLALASAPAAAGGSSGDVPWHDRPLIGTYVAQPGQTAQRLMSDLRLEAIGASW